MTAALAPDIIPVRPSLRDRIAEEFEFDPNVSDERAAERVLRRVTKDELLPLLIAEVATVRRDTTRRAERRVIDRLVEAVRPQGAHRRAPEATVAQARQRLNDMYSDLLALRSQTLDLGDGQTVRWGALTIEQAQQRLAMLRRQRDGMSTTIGQLERVIGVLQVTGTACLDELARG